MCEKEEKMTNPVLEKCQVVRAKSIGLCDDRNQVNPGVQMLHHLDVQRLEGMAGRADEIDTGVDSEIDLAGPFGLLVLEHVGLVLVVDELDDWLPGIGIVDEVAEAGCVDDGEADWREGERVVYTLTRKPGFIPVKFFSVSSAFLTSISTVVS